MTNPADNARRDLGLPLSGANRSTGSDSPHTRNQRLTSSAPGRPMGLLDIANSATPKSSAAVNGLGALGRCSWIALICAVGVALGHRAVLSFAADTSVGFLTEWAVSALTFANAPLWAPWAAAATGLTLLGLACATRGFTRATEIQMITLAVVDVIAMVLAVPVAVALTAGAVLVALVVAAVVAGLALALAVLAAS